MTPPDIGGPLLYVGHLNKGQTSLMRCEAMERLGLAVAPFNARAFLEQRSFLERRIGAMFERSPQLAHMNRALVETARRVRPSVVWFDKQEYVTAASINALKAMDAFLVFYTPDPYFQHAWHQTRTMTQNLSRMDLAVTTKRYELNDYARHGRVVYMPHGFSETDHRPTPVPEAERFDVGFVGSWEPRREALMERLAGAELSVKIWGFGWDHLVEGRVGLRRRARLRRMANGEPFAVMRSEALANYIVPREVYANEYARALSASRISGGFLRRTLYPDTHTTRTFEVPACGSMLLAERTEEHEAFFAEDREAVFFEGEDEFVEKAVYYTRHPDKRDAIAAAGRAKCLAAGYSYTERLRQVMNDVAALRAAKDVLA